MVLLEAMSELRVGDHPLQIFATDVSDAAVARARNGFYPDPAVAEVSPERLHRFFSRVDAGYRVSQSVREHLVFSRQDVTRDPPFSRLDLVVCRNLLIYLNSAVQRRVLRTLHYALRPGGFLLLGDSESIGAQPDLFSAVYRSHRLYLRKDVRTPLDGGVVW